MHAMRPSLSSIMPYSNQGTIPQMLVTREAWRDVRRVCGTGQVYSNDARGFFLFGPALPVPGMGHGHHL